jgi:hypothetical protein
VIEAAARPRIDVDGHAQAHPERHATAGEGELGAVREFPPQGGRQDLAAIGVHPPHARHVPLQLAVRDQRRHRRLGRQVSLDVEQ